MRKIKILGHVSLDGVLDGVFLDEQGREFGREGWTAPFRSPQGMAAVMEEQGGNFDLLLGRRTYDKWSEYWPKARDMPLASGLNSAIKYVVTRRPETLEWGPVQALGPAVPEEIRELKAKGGPDLLVWGSSTLTPLLLESGLVDEVVLLVYPVWVGQGKRIFSDDAGLREFALVRSKASPTGVLINAYRVAQGTEGAGVRRP